MSFSGPKPLYSLTLGNYIGHHEQAATCPYQNRQWRDSASSLHGPNESGTSCRGSNTQANFDLPFHLPPAPSLSRQVGLYELQPLAAHALCKDRHQELNLAHPVKKRNVCRSFIRWLLHAQYKYRCQEPNLKHTNNQEVKGLQRLQAVAASRPVQISMSRAQPKTYNQEVNGLQRLQAVAASRPVQISMSRAQPKTYNQEVNGLQRLQAVAASRPVQISMSRAQPKTYNQEVNGLQRLQAVAASRLVQIWRSTAQYSTQSRGERATEVTHAAKSTG